MTDATVDEINGWYKEKRTKSKASHVTRKKHYFYKSKISLCGAISDTAIVLIPCKPAEKRKCLVCLQVLKTYTSLENRGNFPDYYAGHSAY